LYPYLQSSSADVRKRLCTVLMFGGDQTSLDQLDRLSHDPNSDVAAEALQAKRGLRARLAAARTTADTNQPQTVQDIFISAGQCDSCASGGIHGVRRGQ
jgi:hypothetical protein